jgi:hypothetical protein
MPKELEMISQMQEFVVEQTSNLTDQVQKIRKGSVETVREAAVGSAEGLKALKSPIRQLARSSVKLTSVSQTAVANLIDLQSDMVTSAITDAALRLERASRASSIVDLVRDQYELIPATRERIVEDAQRAVQIFKHAGRDFRGVAANLYDKVVEPVEDKLPEVKVKVKVSKRKPAKAKAKAKRKTTRARRTATAA